MRTLLRWLLRLLYRFRAYNVSALDTPGPVLLLPNHVSWWDWLLIGVCLEDDWRFVTSSTTAEMSWFHRRAMINRRTFPVDMTSPFAVKHMAEYLQKGGRLVLFPEGRLSCTGSLMKLFDGTGFLIFKTQANVITAYIRGAERLPFSPTPGRKRWFPRLSVHFSTVLTPPNQEPVRAIAARARLTDWLRDQMITQRFETEMEFGPATLPEAIAETAGQRPRQVILQDFTMQVLTYRRLLVGADLLAGQWKTLIAPMPLRAPEGQEGGPTPAPAPGGRTRGTPHPGPLPFGRGEGESSAALRRTYVQGKGVPQRSQSACGRAAPKRECHAGCDLELVGGGQGSSHPELLHRDKHPAVLRQTRGVETHHHIEGIHSARQARPGTL
jgi:1-acyl-sn-glycerol-3-phosphate acyltransferase